MEDWFETVERLRRSEAVWGDGEVPVKLIQTHISVLLLGRTRVLKLKKPVDFGFLDYSTPEKRRAACQREVKLNRRLCPDAYIGVRAVVEEDQKFSLSKEDEAWDYAVLMKRLPDKKMLDSMVLDGMIRESQIARIAKRVSDFHRDADRGLEIDAFGNIETVQFNWTENFEQTKPYVDRTISSFDFERIRTWVQDWIEANKELFAKRVTEGRICDGHGDLRCESVCVTDDICIFDCIEFNKRFRCGDVANEVAFLAMDLEAYGRPDLSYLFCERYIEESGDEEILRLLPFYRCYRAYIRGKVLSFQLDEQELDQDQREEARFRARSYFEIASRCTEEKLQIPTVIVVSGFSGTGKTTIARAVAAEFGCRVVSSDIVRHALFRETGATAGYGAGKYSAESNRRTYDQMIDVGFEYLKSDGTVVLDATFQRAEDFEAVSSKAAKVGFAVRAVECRASPEVIRERLKRRSEEREGASEATIETFEEQRRDERPSLPEDTLIVDTGKEITDVARKIADWIRD